MRKKFSEIFKENDDGSLSPRMTIKIGGIILGGESVKFTRGVKFAGIDIFDYYGKDIEVKEENGIIIIGGFYE